MEANLRVMLSSSGIGLCEGWDNTIIKTVRTIYTQKAILTFTDYRT
jgi:hypothetical protein